MKYYYLRAIKNHNSCLQKPWKYNLWTKMGSSVLWISASYSHQVHKQPKLLLAKGAGSLVVTWGRKFPSPLFFSIQFLSYPDGRGIFTYSGASTDPQCLQVKYSFSLPHVRSTAHCLLGALLHCFLGNSTPFFYALFVHKKLALLHIHLCFPGRTRCPWNEGLRWIHCNKSICSVNCK